MYKEDANAIQQLSSLLGIMELITCGLRKPQLQLPSIREPKEKERKKHLRGSIVGFSLVNFLLIIGARSITIFHSYLNVTSLESFTLEQTLILLNKD